MGEDFELEEVPCNLCGSSNAYLVGIKRGQLTRRNFKILKCKHCGLVYVNPRLARDSMTKLYDQEYFAGRGFDPNVNYFDESFLHVHPAGFISDVRCVRPFSPRQKLLDVGCGLGNFLAFAREAGYACYGIDISPFAVKYVQNRFPDVKIFEGGINEVSLPQRNFDVITGIEVLEHLGDPMSFFMRCSQLLRREGVFAYTTMNSDRMYAPFNMKERGVNWRYINPEGHLYYYNKDTIQNYFTETRLTPIDIYQNGLWRHIPSVRVQFKKFHVFDHHRLPYAFFNTIQRFRDKANGNLRLPWARLKSD